MTEGVAKKSLRKESEENAYEYVNKYISDNYKGIDKLPKIKIAKRLDVTEILND